MAGRRRTGRAAAWAAGLLLTTGCLPSAPGRPQDRPLDGGGVAALSACGKHGHVLDPGPRPPKDSATPQMVVLSYGYSSDGADDPGRITIDLSIAPGSATPLLLGRPLGGRGPSVEIHGPDGMVMAAHSMPVTLATDPPGDELEAGPEPLNFEIVIPAAAMCPGHSLRDAVTEGTEPGEKAHTLTVGVRDPAVARHRTAHGIDDAGDLLVASWPPGPEPADGGGTFPDDETPGRSTEPSG
ncbi:hypothetical protein [Streptomyces sp. NRRL S-237]|uniref:hypothetical protein n=1 Tax=Streptomyces sp. NRRL S-237 TaxID=1463895 RepID=UPI00131CF17E|nr:hypothetical protein [Streptomyces sp. NRRL S-237]